MCISRVVSDAASVDVAVADAATATGDDDDKNSMIALFIAFRIKYLHTVLFDVRVF